MNRPPCVVGAKQPTNHKTSTDSGGATWAPSAKLLRAGVNRVHRERERATRARRARWGATRRAPCAGVRSYAFLCNRITSPSCPMRQGPSPLLGVPHPSAQAERLRSRATKRGVACERGGDDGEDDAGWSATAGGTHRGHGAAATISTPLRPLSACAACACARHVIPWPR